MNAIFYVARSGCAWRLLPHEFPSWQTAYHYFRLWRLDGTWEHLHHVLREQLRTRVGRHPQPSAGIIDSHSENRAGVPLFLDGATDAFPRIEHLWVDQGYTGSGKSWIDEHLGWRVEVVRHPPQPRGEWAPHGDRQDWRTMWFSWERLPPSPKVFRGVLPRRWVVERTFAWLCQESAINRDYERLCTTSEALSYAAMGRLMLRRLARI